MVNSYQFKGKFSNLWNKYSLFFGNIKIKLQQKVGRMFLYKISNKKKSIKSVNILMKFTHKGFIRFRELPFRWITFHFFQFESFCPKWPQHPFRLRFGYRYNIYSVYNMYIIYIDKYILYIYGNTPVCPIYAFIMSLSSAIVT